MPLCNPADLQLIRGPGQRLLGLDLGTKTIGLALSDTRRRIASPLATLRRGKFRDDAGRLRQLVESREVGAMVIGLPIAMDGSEGPRCQSARQFARNLLAIFDIPIAFWDERLSTRAVEREMIAADLTRKRRGEIVDRVAAAYILQGFLDWLGSLPAQPG
ncbi:MAG TPA: Holliday junction resolvase RuvX [Stellaceae bacterium]|nr:Holliday junction resolvase RuvX [Stellaceae bacterium]